MKFRIKTLIEVKIIFNENKQKGLYIVSIMKYFLFFFLLILRFTRTCFVVDIFGNIVLLINLIHQRFNPFYNLTLKRKIEL